MSMGRPMGGGRGMRSVDERALREQNSKAPKVPDLGKRILDLFRPYRKRVAMTALLVVAGAALGAIPPLVIQRVFDEALFPEVGGVNMGLLGWLVGFMIALYVIASGVQIVQTWLTSSVGNRVAGDLRIR